MSAAIAASGLGFSAVGLVVPAAPASAAACGTFTWTGIGAAAGNSNWSDPLNWQGGTAPAAGCTVSLVFPFTATQTGTANNDIANLEIVALNITGTFDLTGLGVFMGDSSTPASVTASANSTLHLSQNLQNKTTYGVSSGNTLTDLGSLVGSATGTQFAASGPGTLILGAANTYSGPSQVNGGTVELTNPAALGLAANAVTVAAGSVLQLGPGSTSSFIVPQQVTLGGTVVGSGADERLSSQLTLAAAGGSLASTGKLTVAQITGGQSGGPGLSVNPGGFGGAVVLGGSTNNTYAGGTTVDGGTLSLDVVPTSGTGTATPGPLTVNSGGLTKLGAPGQLDPTSTLTVVGTGSIDLANNASTVANLTLNSTSTSGAPSVTSTGGSGPLTVTSTILSEGTGRPSVIAAGLNLAPTGPPGAAVSVQSVNSLVLTGTLAGGNLTLSTPPAPLSYPACTSNTSANTCVATVIAGNSGAYAGQISVGAGVLDVKGTLGATPVSVQGGTLTGIGTVGSLNMSSGAVDPGTTVTYQPGSNLTGAESPGVLNASSFAATGGTLNVRIDGISPGNGSTTCSGYDQLNVVAGPAGLGTGVAALNVISDKGSNGVPCLVPANGQVYTIVVSPSTTGQFTGDAEGGKVQDAASPYQYTISYKGGTTGNDVTLTSSVNDTVTVALAQGTNPSTYGEQLKFNATVSPTSGTPPITGTVAFTDSVANGGSSSPAPVACSESTATPKDNQVSLSGGTASCTPTTALPGGVDTITATYSGDGSFASNTGTLAQTVNPQTTSTAVAPGTNPSPSTYGQQVTFTATLTAHPTANQQSPVVAPTGTVTFFANGTPLGDCTGMTVTTSSGVSKATCNTKDLPTGTDKVTATYSGDTNYGTSTDSTGTNQSVSAASTTTTLSSGSPSTSVFGQPVTFTATVQPASTGPTAPSGTVTFKANGTALADCSSQAVSTTSGTTTATCPTSDLPVGNPVSVTAVYNGDGTNYTASPTSNAVNQTVNKASTTTTLSTSSPNPSAAGQTVTYTATVAVTAPGAGAPTGNVTFMDNNSPAACATGTQNVTTSGGVTSAACSVTYGTAGQHSIVATYNGDGNFTSSVSSALSHNVAASATATSIASTAGSQNPSVYGQQVSFTATVNPTGPAPTVPPTGTVTFLANGNALPDCTAVPLSGSGTTGTSVCNTHDVPVGNPVALTAAYNGDTNYGASSSAGSVNQTVSKASSATSISADSPDPSVFGQPVTFVATITPTPSTGPASPTGSVDFKVGPNLLADCTGVTVSTSSGATTATCSTRDLAVGTDAVTAVYGGDGNYTGSSTTSPASQTVNSDATTVTLTSSANPSAKGQSVTFTARVAAAPPGSGTPTGSVEFDDPGTPISGCSARPLTTSGGITTATCTVAFNSIGDRAVSAVYLGDANFVGSNSDALTQKVVHSVNPAGYWLVASDGGIFSFGPGANFQGSTGAQHLNAPIVGMAEDPATGGYWLVASDGGIFSFGAPFFGSTGSIHLNAPIVGMAAAPDGNGYWLVASDGGIFSFGPSATFFGSTGSITLNRPVVGMAAAPDGNGYWLVASDGGIFAFGPSAQFFGSTGSIHLNQPIVGMAAAPDGNGYWLVASDGGIFAFGPSAGFYGSMGSATLNRPVVGMAASG